MATEGVGRRFFVTIEASNERAMHELRRYGLDLVRGTAVRAMASLRAAAAEERAAPLTVEGVITLEQAERLVLDGYRVTLADAASRRARAPLQVVELEAWLPHLDARAAPGAGYLSVAGLEAALEHLARTYPALCTRLPLPERTHEGRTSSFLRIGASASRRSGVLLMAGVHAREVVNPDLLVSLACRLCRAYASRAGLTFGGKAYRAQDVRQIVEGLDLYVFPLVNPDGRAFVLSPAGDPMWRKNRRPTVGSSVGVDVNRNFDFLWSSGIGTSSDPADYQLYKGDAAMSEVEARNVRHLLDAYPIATMADVHSYSELVMWPWGDDEEQSSTPGMNFLNPAYDGARGTPGDAYKEYIPAADLRWFADTGRRIAAAIAAVRGRAYTAEPSAGLYPTSGCSNDYAYARHFAARGARAVRAFAIETGREFQPVHAEAAHVIDEVSAGLVELCLAALRAERSARPARARRPRSPAPA